MPPEIVDFSAPASVPPMECAMVDIVRTLIVVPRTVTSAAGSVLGDGFAEYHPCRTISPWEKSGDRAAVRRPRLNSPRRHWWTFAPGAFDPFRDSLSGHCRADALLVADEAGLSGAFKAVEDFVGHCFLLS